MDHGQENMNTVTVSAEQCQRRSVGVQDLGQRGHQRTGGMSSPAATRSQPEWMPGPDTTRSAGRWWRRRGPSARWWPGTRSAPRDQLNPAAGARAKATSTSTTANPPTASAPRRHHRSAEGSAFACSMSAIVARRQSRAPGITFPSSPESSQRDVSSTLPAGVSRGEIVESSPDVPGTELSEVLDVSLLPRRAGDPGVAVPRRRRRATDDRRREPAHGDRVGRAARSAWRASSASSWRGAA